MASTSQRTACELGHTVNVRPIFDWTCVGKTLKDASSFPVESNPPRPCPKRCSQHTSCGDCLASAGGEGGWHECRWSSALSEEDLVDRFSVDLWKHVECPATFIAKQPIVCVTHDVAGVVCMPQVPMEGASVCVEGTGAPQVDLVGQLPSSCMVILCLKDEHHAFCTISNVSYWLQTLGSEVYWYYFVRPPENECTNGHHTCDAEREECVDTPDGFECVCKQGYAISSNSSSTGTGGTSNGNPMCEPVCPEGCDQGQCVRPNECKCNFGYVGLNCSILCHCNGHSDCAGPDHLDVCTKCHNHTKVRRRQQFIFSLSAVIELKLFVLVI
ncbi:hypothetical protein HPB51_001393 [Rhipicephalus microplus]|uniref:EGF-like domain-containing protein n=1 Tax=Rhipicephalus microplus TaxID=6941 RepID=A0A9J6EF11_RHIMP|nr:hypothetical protein HPB51_001393 [Rhipicephalus microplus]